MVLYFNIFQKEMYWCSNSNLTHPCWLNVLISFKKKRKSKKPAVFFLTYYSVKNFDFSTYLGVANSEIEPKEAL